MFHVSLSDGLSHVPDVIFGRLFLCSREIDELLTFSCAYALLPCIMFFLFQIVYMTSSVHQVIRHKCNFLMFFIHNYFVTCLKWNTRSISKQLLLSWMLIIQCAALHTETNTIVLDWCRVRFHVSNSHIMGDYQYHHTPGQATFISKIK